MTRSAAAEELDLNAVTLANWEQRQAEQEDTQPATMLPVAVLQSHEAENRDRAPQELVVIHPTGVRVEGLDIDGVALLLEKLS